MAYAFNSCFALSDRWLDSAVVDVLCIEQRLLCELDGVRFRAKVEVEYSEAVVVKLLLNDRLRTEAVP
jgi:very-short-patch-repair endonuclease